MKRVFSCVVAASLALSLLVGCGASSTASSAASSAASSEAASSVASSAAETAALPDGVYTAEFDTDSSMFHANEACDGKGTLTVENGQMTFHVSLASTHIVNLYLGKASDAFESVDCQIAGLGEIEDVQKLYVAHTKAAIDSLNG